MNCDYKSVEDLLSCHPLFVDCSQLDDTLVRVHTNMKYFGGSDIDVFIGAQEEDCDIRRVSDLSSSFCILFGFLEGDTYSPERQRFVSDIARTLGLQENAGEVYVDATRSELWAALTKVAKASQRMSYMK